MNRDVPPISVAPQYPVRRPRSFAPGRDAVPAAARRRISGVFLSARRSKGGKCRTQPTR